ncbi:MAG: hypothetical protein ABUS49_01645 [Acidobacteriota bacterium]
MKSEDMVSLSIDAFSPRTLPMSRLADYLKAFSAMLGSEANVHFDRVGEGSTVLKAHIDQSAAPKVHERIHAVASGTAPKSAMRAFSEIDDLMAKDNAIGQIALGNQSVIVFPGRLRAAHETIGPVRRSTSVEGQVFLIGGKDETINVHLRNGDEEIRCVVSLPLARELGPHLRGRKVRLFGSGVYFRVDGVWQRRSFTAASFVLLDEASLAATLASVRSVFAGVDANEFMEAMVELRSE